MTSVVISKTPVVQSTPDYADGDVIGGKMTLAAVAFAGNSGAILSAAVYSAADIGTSIPIRVMLFNADPAASTFDENSAPTIDATDIGKLIGVLDLSQRLDLGTPVVLFASNPNVPFNCPAGSSLYAVAIAGGVVNLAAVTDLTFMFGIQRD